MPQSMSGETVARLVMANTMALVLVGIYIASPRLLLGAIAGSLVVLTYLAWQVLRSLEGRTAHPGQ